MERLKENSGFTLLELMIVVAILGILAALAAPFFIEAKARANDLSASADAKGAITIFSSMRR